MTYINFKKSQKTRVATGPPSGGTRGKEAVLPVSVPDRTTAVVEGIVMILDHHNATKAVIESIVSQLRSYLDSSENEMVWVRRFKYLSSLPLALFLKNTPPLQPDSVPFRFTGLAKRWTRNRLKVDNSENRHLWYSWFQSKRAAAPCSKEFLWNTYEDHREKLTSDDPGLDEEFGEDTIDSIFENPTFLYVLEKLRKSVKKASRNFVQFPGKMSACYENTRSDGGQYQQLLDLAGIGPVGGELGETYEYSFDGFAYTSNLRIMRWFPHVIGHGPCVLEQRESPFREDWESLDHLSWNSGAANPWWLRNLNCGIVGVIEPVKVRTISKGEALPYFSQRWLQKVLHGKMRKMPCFRLLDRPLGPTDLMDLVRPGTSKYEWFSIDYSGATDGLSWAYSSRILESLLEGSDLLRAKAVLGPHNLIYPLEKKEGKMEIRIPDALQRNGQLMGSILSFPILCLANLGVYLLNTESLPGRDPEDILGKVLVNGDDMLYRAPADLWDSHIIYASNVGLEMSIGKAYHHPSYANINSTSLTAKYGLAPYEIPYLNVGLAFQSEVQKKRGNDVEMNEKSTTVSCINKLLGGCLERKRMDILKWYLTRYASEIREETRGKLVNTKTRRVSSFTRNLFVSPTLGGMGVTPPTGWKFKIKRIDRRVARSSLDEAMRYDQLPARGPLVEKLGPPPDPWVKPIGLSACYMVVGKPLKVSIPKSALLTGLYAYSRKKSVSLSPSWTDVKGFMGFPELNYPKRWSVDDLNSSVLSGQVA